MSQRSNLPPSPHLSPLASPHLDRCAHTFRVLPIHPTIPLYCVSSRRVDWCDLRPSHRVPSSHTLMGEVDPPITLSEGTRQPHTIQVRYSHPLHSALSSILSPAFLCPPPLLPSPLLSPLPSNLPSIALVSNGRRVTAITCHLTECTIGEVRSVQRIQEKVCEEETGMR